MTDTVAPPSTRATTRDEAPPTPPVLLALRAWGLVVALVALIPLAVVRVPWAADGAYDDLNRSVALAPFDLVLLVVLARWALSLRGRTWTRPTPLQAIGIALAVDLAVAFAFHPSPLGVAEGLRLLAGWAVVDTVVEAGADRRRLLLGGITIVGVAQATLGMAQSLNGAILGLGPLEFGGKLYTFGSSHAGRGGLTHPYHLACLLLVAVVAALLGLRGSGARPWPWLAALVVLSTGIATTFSRSAVLGLAMVVVTCLAAGVRRRAWALPLAAVAIVVGLGIGMVGFGDGWVAKAKTSSNAQQVDSARRDRLEEAKGLVESSPFVGIGPGRYVAALSGPHGTGKLPAHDVVAQEAAEGGILAGLLTAALVLGLAWWSWRRGAWACCAYLALIPFFVLDAYPYVFSTGLALSAVWLGLLVLAAEPDREPIAP